MMAPARASVVILLLTASIVAAAALYYFKTHRYDDVIRSDGRAYYAYLRLYLIHRGYEFEQLPDFDGDLSLWFRRSPRTGRVAAFYPIGTALAELPFFVVGHAAAVLTGRAQDGLSSPYHRAISLAGLCWLILGAFATWNVLAARFSQTTASLGTAIIVLGTNLLHYSIGEPSMSHVYGFGAVALMLWLGDRFWSTPSVGRAVALGLSAGLVVSIRNYDALLVLLVLFPALRNPAVAGRYGAAFLGGAAVSFLPQFVTATYYLGAPWGNTYWGLSFAWAHPQVLNVLFSVKKGWWFWTPVAGIAFVGLVGGLATVHRWFCALSLLTIAATVYMVAAWADWAMGASFGHRAFVDLLPALAVGIGLVLRYQWARIVLPCLVAFNLFLTWAYWNGEINPDGATLRSYYKVLSLPLSRLSASTAGDSSSRVGLAADVAVTDVRRFPDHLSVTASARNTGSALWLSDFSKGQVYLDVRPFNNAKCEGPFPWEWREPIVNDVAPSQSVTIVARVPARLLTMPFKYLCVELLSVAWFRDVGPSVPAVVTVEPQISPAPRRNAPDAGSRPPRS